MKALEGKIVVSFPVWKELSDWCSASHCFGFCVSLNTRHGGGRPIACGSD